MSLKTHLQAWSDLYSRYKQIFAAAWSVRHETDSKNLQPHEAQFLPAALSLQETPVSPAPRVWSSAPELDQEYSACSLPAPNHCNPPLPLVGAELPSWERSPQPADLFAGRASDVRAFRRLATTEEQGSWRARKNNLRRISCDNSPAVFWIPLDQGLVCGSIRNHKPTFNSEAI